MVNTAATDRPAFRVHGVRYQSRDLSRAVAFYTKELGVLLSGAQSSGARPLPNGQQQEPGGWNRLVLAVADLAATVDSLKSRGVQFRNEVITGPGGKQVQILDPDGNPIELFEPAARN